MNGLIRRFVKDDRGAALIWLFLITPLIISMALWRMDYSQTVTLVEIDFQETLKKAVKAAANQVTEKSQAEGDPRIHSDKANEAFRRIIAENLKLDPVTLSPKSVSPFKNAPVYILLVYNGDNAYESTGARAAYRYEFDGSSLGSYPLSGFGFPQQFTVSDFNITYGTGGTFDVTLESPGCIGLVKISPKTINDTEVQPIRWAPAVVHVN